MDVPKFCLFGKYLEVFLLIGIKATCKLILFIRIIITQHIIKLQDHDIHETNQKLFQRQTDNCILFLKGPILNSTIRSVSLSKKKSTMSLVEEFMPPSKFKYLTWSPLIWKLDTDSYRGLMGRSFVPIAFAKRHARTIKINTFFVAMVLFFVSWCVRLGYVMERERYEEKLRFGRLFIEVLVRRYQIF